MCDRWRRYEELIRAGDEDVLIKTLRRIEDLNVTDGANYKTLGHILAEHGQVSLLHKLVKRGLHLDSATMIKYNCPEVEGKPNSAARIENQDLTLVHVAARAGNTKVLEYLANPETGLDREGKPLNLKAKRLDGDTPIHMAARHGHDACVAILCRYADPPREEGDDSHGHHLPPINTPSATTGHVNPGAEDDPGARVQLNIYNQGGATPAHLAALNGRVGALQILMRAGADMAQANPKDRSTPLDWAIRNEEEAVVELLLSAGLTPTPPLPPLPPPPVEDDGGKGKKKKGGKKKKK
jgi:ankyrin repeat protein